MESLCRDAGRTSRRGSPGGLGGGHQAAFLRGHASSISRRDRQAAASSWCLWLEWESPGPGRIIVRLSLKRQTLRWQWIVTGPDGCPSRLLRGAWEYLLARHCRRDTTKVPANVLALARLPDAPIPRGGGTLLVSRATDLLIWLAVLRFTEVQALLVHRFARTTSSSGRCHTVRGRMRFDAAAPPEPPRPYLVRIRETSSGHSGTGFCGQHSRSSRRDASPLPRLAITVKRLLPRHRVSPSFVRPTAC